MKSVFWRVAKRLSYKQDARCLKVNILRCLRDAVRRKRPEKWGTNGWFLLAGNSPACLSVLVKDFLTKNIVTTLEQPPYAPDLAPADFYLFP